jgi:hypothetical protein
MALQIDGIIFDTLTADPGSPSEGQLWYNSTTFLYKVYRNGVVTSFTDAVTFAAHATSTSNPHSTTLEQARTAGNTLSGSINMGGNAITNLGAGSNPTDAAQRQWVTDQVNQKVAGLDWQESVLSRLGTPPGTPSTGDRYLVAPLSYAVVAVDSGTETVSVLGDITTLLSTGNTLKVVGSTGNDGTYTVTSVTFNSPNTDIVVTGDFTSAVADGSVQFASGAWNTKVDQIAEWSGLAWTYGVPNEGWTTRVEAENVVYTYDGASWGNFGNATDHGALLGLGDDDHLQYLPRSGVRAMTGALNMGTNNITSAGTINGVTITAHASRHNPGGADALAVGLPVAITDSTNATGIGSSYALNDHQHAHGNRGGGSLHSVVTSTAHGFAPQSHFSSTVNPTASDDNTVGYVPGSVWINTTAQTVWQAISVATGAAVWVELTNAASLLKTKAGRVLAASFAGNPKKATVTFATAFVDSAYSVTISPVITPGGSTYAPVIESQLAGSFVINVGSNNIGSLVAVNWTAVKSGESA